MASASALGGVLDELADVDELARALDATDAREGEQVVDQRLHALGAVDGEVRCTARRARRAVPRSGARASGRSSSPCAAAPGGRARRRRRTARARRWSAPARAAFSWISASAARTASRSRTIRSRIDSTSRPSRAMSLGPLGLDRAGQLAAGDGAHLGRAVARSARSMTCRPITAMATSASASRSAAANTSDARERCGGAREVRARIGALGRAGRPAAARARRARRRTAPCRPPPPRPRSGRRRSGGCDRSSAARTPVSQASMARRARRQVARRSAAHPRGAPASSSWPGERRASLTPAR